MGVVPIAWKNRYKKSISSNPSIISVTFLFADDKRKAIPHEDTQLPSTASFLCFFFTHCAPAKNNTTLCRPPRSKHDILFII